eukprot:5538481-Pleurochrysis_carterae.AAC.1
MQNPSRRTRVTLCVVPLTPRRSPRSHSCSRIECDLASVLDARLPFAGQLGAAADEATKLVEQARSDLRAICLVLS